MNECQHEVVENKCVHCGMKLHDIVNSGLDTCEASKQQLEKQKLHSRTENDFNHHTPSPEGCVKIEGNREAAKTLAHYFIENCPPSRELSLALTKLEEVLFYANAAIARKL